MWSAAQYAETQREGDDAQRALGAYVGGTRRLVARRAVGPVRSQGGLGDEFLADLRMSGRSEEAALQQLARCGYSVERSSVTTLASLGARTMLRCTQKRPLSFAFPDANGSATPGGGGIARARAAASGGKRRRARRPRPRPSASGVSG